MLNITVLSGSPKGIYSFTIQSVYYLQKIFPEISFTIFHIGQKIKRIEKDTEFLDKILKQVEKADCILWCYPVYSMLIPYQLMRFIDIIFDNRTIYIWCSRIDDRNSIAIVS